MSCYRLAGFGVCALFALMSPSNMRGIFSRVKRKSVLGDMAFPSFRRYRLLAVLAFHPFQNSARIMPWYYNQNNERIEVTIRQLLSLAENGEITPDTQVEIDEGNIIPARRMRITDREGNRTRLPFRDIPPQHDSVPEPTPIPVSVPSPVERQVFCTSCGKSINEQADFCPSCCIEPTGHRMYCRQCGIALNSEQVICSQCQTPLPEIQGPQQFCTYCGNPVAKQAKSCLSCGCAPTEHKKFCRKCGVATNPEQIICIRCGAEMPKPTQKLPITATRKRWSANPESPTWAPNSESTLSPPRFFDIFDIGFTRFITNVWISIIWIIVIIGHCSVVPFVYFSLSDNLLVALLLTLLSLLGSRMLLELIIVIFRIETNTRESE